MSPSRSGSPSSFSDAVSFPHAAQLIGPIQVPTDIIVSIIQQSDTIAVLSWRRTSRALFTVAATVLRQRYHASVVPFFSDVARLDQLLRQYGALISGSVALQFFLNEEPWTPGDLDIYVPAKYYRAFVQTIVRDDRFALRFHPRQRIAPAAIADELSLDLDYVLLALTDTEGDGIPSPAADSQGIKQVLRFRTSTGRNVDIVCSPVDDAITALHAFWSTLVANFISPDGCGCGFPAGTINRKGFVKAGSLTQRDLAAVIKYTRRGFTIVHDRWQSMDDDPSMWDIDYFGDVDAMALSFRLHANDQPLPLPVERTDRGWHIIHPFPRTENLST
ncbi:hypothetical protein C8Q76DRAFT_797458 [Earliella scabrosa]|nr:hypothetical protein C8Q76DRAFT_797458 [Earliella scabrosa]